MSTITTKIPFHFSDDFEGTLVDLVRHRVSKFRSWDDDGGLVPGSYKGIFASPMDPTKDFVAHYYELVGWEDGVEPVKRGPKAMSGIDITATSPEGETIIERVMSETFYDCLDESETTWFVLATPRTTQFNNPPLTAAKKRVVRRALTTGIGNAHLYRKLLGGGGNDSFVNKAELNSVYPILTPDERLLLAVLVGDADYVERNTSPGRKLPEYGLRYMTHLMSPMYEVGDLGGAFQSLLHVAVRNLPSFEDEFLCFEGDKPVADETTRTGRTFGSTKALFEGRKRIVERLASFPRAAEKLDSEGLTPLSVFLAQRVSSTLPKIEGGNYPVLFASLVYPCHYRRYADVVVGALARTVEKEHYEIVKDNHEEFRRLKDSGRISRFLSQVSEPELLERELTLTPEMFQRIVGSEATKRRRAKEKS